MHEAWNYLGYTHRKLGDYQAALTAYDRALNLKPGYPEAIEYRGHAYLGLNRLEDAKQAYLTLFAGNRQLAAQLLAAHAGTGWVSIAAIRPDRRRLARGVRLLGERAQRHRQPDRRAHPRGRQRRLVTPPVELQQCAARAQRRHHRHADRHGGVVAVRLRRANTAGNCRVDFPQPAVPADNPMSDAKVALGARLFADPRLSVNGSYSCQSCHAPERAFTDGRARSRGATGAELELNAPTLLNAAYNASLGWSDAGILTLEQQMRGPLFNEHPPELGLAGREGLVEATLAADAALAPLFAAAFPGGAPAVSMDNVIRAIAAYERTLVAGNSAFDRYVFAGDHDALDARQKRGMATVLFGTPAVRAAMAASTSRDRGWIGIIRGRSGDLRRHRHRQDRARADPAQSAGQCAVSCTMAASRRSMRCSITMSGSRPIPPPIRACGARH